MQDHQWEVRLQYQVLGHLRRIEHGAIAIKDREMLQQAVEWNLQHHN
jgi:hypothetical protein